jgi:hypothetical protein
MLPIVQLEPRENGRVEKLTEITNVSLVVRGTTVVLASGVEVTSSRGTAVASWSTIVQARNLEAYVLSPNSLLTLADRTLR